MGVLQRNGVDRARVRAYFFGWVPRKLRGWFSKGNTHFVGSILRHASVRDLKGWHPVPNFSNASGCTTTGVEGAKTYDEGPYFGESINCDLLLEQCAQIIPRVVTT